MQEEEPGFWVGDGFHELALLEMFLLDTGVVILDAKDRLCPLFWCQEVGRDGAVGEEDPYEPAIDDGQTACDYHEPFPGTEVSSLDPQDAVREQTRCYGAGVADCPHARHEDSLFIICEEHGEDEEEGRNDAGLCHAEEESHDEETCEIRAWYM